MYVEIEDYRKHFMKNYYKFNKKKTKSITKKNKLSNDFDKLFFNFLIIYKYDIPMNFNKNEEKKIKYIFAQKLQDFKYKKKEEIVQNLCYDDNIDLRTIDCLSKFFNLNFIYTYGNIFINMINNDNTKIYIINHKKDIFYLSSEKLEYILKSLYEIKDIHKPIYCESHYKLSDLKDIIKKIDIDNNNLILKKDYYKQLKNYINTILF